MATEARTLPRRSHLGALRQAMREQRDKMPDFGRMLWRRKLLIVACVVVVLGLTAAYVSTLAPAYQAEALVAVADRTRGQGARTPSSKLEDQRGLIESRAMAERLVDRLDLHFVPEFRPSTGSGLRVTDAWLPHALLERLPKAWAETLSTDPPNGEVTDEQRAARLWQEVTATTMARIRADVRPPSVIGLRFISEDPQLAAAGANALAELYLEARLALRQSASPRDPARLEQEIERLRASIRETEQAIGAERAGAGAPAHATAEESRLGLTDELAFWRRERAKAEARLRQAEAALQSGAASDQAALSTESERLRELQARATELQQVLADLSRQYGEQDPQIVELRTQLAGLEQERRAEIEHVVQGMQEELALIRSREAELAANVEAPEEQSAEGQATSRLAALEQKLEADRAALREYLDQAVEQLGTQPSPSSLPDARVIAPAVAPDEPAYPRLTLIWSVATAGALLLGILLALAREALQRGRA